MPFEGKEFAQKNQELLLALLQSNHKKKIRDLNGDYHESFFRFVMV